MERWRDQGRSRQGVAALRCDFLRLRHKSLWRWRTVGRTLSSNLGCAWPNPSPKKFVWKKERSQTNCCYKQSTGNSWQANHGKSIGFDRQQIHSSHSNLVTMTCIKSVHQTVHCLSPGIQIKISQAMPALCSCAKLRPSFFSRVCKCWISTSRDKGSAGTLTLTQLLDSPPCLRFSRSRPKGSKRSN
jgi:hypothetical protein